MTTNKITELECVVYKSLKKDETYVFIPTTTPLSELPEELLKVLGETELVMTLKLTPEKPHLNKNPLPTHNERFLDKDI